MNAPQNPPAFPGPGEVIDRVDPGTGGPAYDIYGPSTQGMTLRDWFAGQALPALLRDRSLMEGFCDSGPPAFAEAAYDIADAMLRIRGAA